MLKLVSVSLLALVFSAGVVIAEDKKIPERINTILKIEYIIDKSIPPNLNVTAKGVVSTKGWERPFLIRREYKNFPADGIWGYDLLATPPEETAGDAPDEIEATNKWEAYPQDKLKGIRVYGARKGIIEIKF